MASRSYSFGKSRGSFGGTVLPPTFSAKEFAALHAYVAKAKRAQTPPWVRLMRLFAIRPAQATSKTTPRTR